METREDPESTDKIHDMNRMYDEFEKTFIGKHETEANEQVKIRSGRTRRNAKRRNDW